MPNGIWIGAFILTLGQQMPYLIQKKSGKSEYCVYKKGADGKPIGDPHGCHPSHEKALSQMRALYANEGKSFELFGEENKAVTQKRGKESRTSSQFLIVGDKEKPDTWNLPTHQGGKLSPRLLGAVHAALTVGYRGNKYEGEGKEGALKKLKRLYQKAGLKWPERKEDNKKSLSLMELEHKVHHAIKEKMMEVGGVEDEYDMPYCPTDVFVDFAIVKSPNGLYQIPYSFDAETYDVTLGEPNKVKIEYVPDDTENDGDSESVDAGDEKYKEMMDKKALDELLSVKALSDDRVGGYALIWGSESQKDLTGEFFDAQTDELKTIFSALGRLPLLYHHGLDESIKTSVIGIVDDIHEDSVGMWYSAQLRKSGEYDEYIKKLIAGGKLKTSSQTFGVARKVNEETGRIERWPLVELSVTPTPAEHRLPSIEFLKSAFSDVGCTDFACVLKKFGVQDTEDVQGIEKIRMLAEVEQTRLEIELV